MFQIRLKRWLKRGAVLSRGFAILSIIGSLIGFWGLKEDIKGDLRISTIIGLIALAILFLNALAVFLHDLLWKEQKIVAMVNLKKSIYDFDKLADAAQDEIIFVGQNLYGLITREEFFPKIKLVLSNKKKLRVVIIFSIPKIVKEIAPPGALEHFLITVSRIDNFLQCLPEEDKSRVTICFHKGASSLSVTIVDKDSASKGILVFNPKWSDDTKPGARVYCIVERWENKDIFDSLSGQIAYMISTNKLSVKDALAQLSKLVPGNS